MIVYSLLLVGLVVALFVGLGTRPELDFTVVRPPGEPFTLLPGGLVSNHFSVRLHNRWQVPKQVRIEISSPPGAQLIVPVNPVDLQTDEQVRTEVFVNLPADLVKSGKVPVRLQAYEDGALAAERSMTFLGPVYAEHENDDEHHDGEGERGEQK